MNFQICMHCKMEEICETCYDSTINSICSLCVAANEIKQLAIERNNNLKSKNDKVSGIIF